MTESDSTVETVALVGGRPCLDFSNTTSERRGPAPRERLHTYRDLLAWSRRLGLVEASGAERLLRHAQQREGAARALARARELRESIYRIFSSVAAGAAPPDSDLDRLNRVVAEALAHRRVVRRGDRFAWEWMWDRAPLEGVLWPLAQSAAELLTSEELGRVKECTSQDCNWLFLDVSRNRSRRWCEMRECGNRAKARRHYLRRRESGAAD